MIESLRFPPLQRSHPLIDYGGRFRFNSSLFDRLVDGLRRDDWYGRPGREHGSPPLRVLGHLVVMRQSLLRLLGGDAPEPAWAELFAAPTLPPRFLSSCPPPDELVGEFRSLDRPLVHALASVTEVEAGAPRGPADLEEPLTLEACVGFFYFDETFHLGQLGLIRDQLGRSPIR